MIVLNKTSGDDTNTASLAGEILAKIKEGATFQEMASVYSQGSQRSQGGDWAGSNAPFCARNSPTPPSRSNPARSAT